MEQLMVAVMVFVMDEYLELRLAMMLAASREQSKVTVLEWSTVLLWEAEKDCL